MSSCCGAPPTNAAISRRMRSRSSPIGRCAVLLDQFGQLRLAEAVGVLVHRLADAVGEQHQQVARDDAAG